VETDQISDEELLRRLSRHPKIRSGMVSLLGAVDDEGGDLKRADDAEDRLVEEMQRMGQQAMQAWAQGQVHETEQDVRRSGRARRHGKKNSAGTPPLETSA
jgi:hypothetical protein